MPFWPVTIVIRENPEVVGQPKNVIAVKDFSECAHFVKLIFLNQSVHNVLTVPQQ
jgi:hypothetical protein